MADDRIALQLYTLRQQTAQGIEDVLREVAAAGYRAVEFAGYGDLSARQLRGILDHLGVRAVSAHVPYGRLEADAPRVVDELQTLGCEYAVVPGVGEEHRSSPDAVRRLAERFDEWGEVCRAGRLAFGYHNHAFEFEPLDNATMYDLLAGATQPELVHLQIDVYWVLYAGLDPVELLGRYAGRVPTLHAKELSDAPDRSDTTVGDGITPWPELLAAADAAGTRWYIVEQEDDPEHAYRDIRRSLEQLGELVGRHAASSA